MNRRAFARNIAGAVGAAALVNGTGLLPRAAAADSELPFKLSVMLWTILRDQPFEERLQKVADAGYKYVELVGEYGKWTDADFDRANAKRKALGITFDTSAGLKHGVGNPKERDAVVADIKAELPIMERIECPSMIVMSGNVVPGLSREEQHQSCIDGLKAMAKAVEGKKIAGQPVKLLLENIDPEENPKYYLTSVAEGFEIIKKVNHPQVQFLYDFFHEQISEGNLIEKLEKNIEHVGIVHIADVPGRHEPGTGEINYENIFRKLKQLNYRGTVAMEFLPTSDPVGKLRAAREMVINAH
ncbi:MAG TPA: TIM barrel protein [Terriglobales bacterium]|jgi:hydroxypyruvate isomerase|nr:TIM barrel protein [Terriglobales bacterium]